MPSAVYETAISAIKELQIYASDSTATGMACFIYIYCHCQTRLQILLYLLIFKSYYTWKVYNQCMSTTNN
jgi:hypothetical protein